jgi:hypothetical protein
MPGLAQRRNNERAEIVIKINAGDDNNDGSKRRTMLTEKAEKRKSRKMRGKPVRRKRLIDTQTGDFFSPVRRAYTGCTRKYAWRIQTEDSVVNLH